MNNGDSVEASGMADEASGRHRVLSHECKKRYMPPFAALWFASQEHCTCTRSPNDLPPNLIAITANHAQYGRTVMKAIASAGKKIVTATAPAYSPHGVLLPSPNA